MQSLVIENPSSRDLSLRSRDIPKINKEQVLVKVLYAGICGTDVKLKTGKYPIAPSLYPLTLGHEFVGEVIEIGTSIEEISIGNIVVGKPTITSCKKCEHCLSGNNNLCKTRLRLGIDSDGAFCEFVVLNKDQIIKIPERISPLAAVMLEPLSVVVRGISKSKVVETDKVAVVGPGTIGLLSAIVLRQRGAEITLIGTDEDSDRFELAKSLGIADYVCTSDDANSMKEVFDVLVDCTGQEQAINQGIDLLKVGGEFILIGTNSSPMTIDFSQIAYKELRVAGTIGTGLEDWSSAFKLLEENESNILQLIGPLFHMEEHISAFQSLNTKQPKVVFKIS